MNINIEIADAEVKVNGKRIDATAERKEGAEEEYHRKIKKYRHSHIRHWIITEDNCHLVGLNKREFGRFIALPAVAVYVNNGAIKREQIFELLKTFPCLYVSSADKNNLC